MSDFDAIIVEPAQGPRGFAGTDGADGEQGPKGDTGPGYLATSATSLAIGTGSKAITTQSGLAYQVGTRARATSRADGTKWMEGYVTGYASNTLTINVDATSGSGSAADWNITVTGLALTAGDQADGTNNQTIANTKFVQTAVANRLRVDTSQGLNGTQQAQGRDNLGLGSASIASTGASGHAVPFIDGANTWSALQKFGAAAFVDQVYDLGAASGLIVITPDPLNGNLQHILNQGNWGLAVPESNCRMILDIVNDTGAGTITTAGWTLVDGDALDSTVGRAFRCEIVVSPIGSSLSVKKLYDPPTP